VNHKQYQLIIDINNIILRFIIAFGIMGFILIIGTGDTNYVRNILFLFPAPFVSYLIGKKARHLWLFITMHLLLIAVYMLWFNQIIYYAIFGLYLFILAVMTLVQRLREKRIPGNTPLGFITAVLVAYICCDFMKQADMKPFFLISAIIYIMLYFVNLHFFNLRNYIIIHEDVAKIPVRQIVSSNHFLFFSFCLLCLVMMLLFAQLPLKELVVFIGRALKNALIFLLSLVHFQENDLKRTQPQESPVMQDNQMGLLPPAEEDPSPIMEILSKILFYASVVLLVIALVAGIIYLLYSLYKRFYAKKADDSRDKSEFISPFADKSRLRREKFSLHKKFRFALGKTNNEKIRKHYYDAIAANADSDLLSGAMTPTQLTGYAFGKESKSKKRVLGEEKQKELTQLYEKARYGREECSKHDLGRIRKMLK
jgi:hypothetical protein